MVFDCSASFEGHSLNDKLLQGPDLSSNLVGVLTRFRQEKYAFMADIEKMFFQVRVRKEDQSFLRFLWWPNGDVQKEAEEYCMTVHLFGAVSSPACANYALKRTADNSEDEYGSEAANPQSPQKLRAEQVKNLALGQYKLPIERAIGVI